jgi:hypothetical protein
MANFVNTLKALRHDDEALRLMIECAKLRQEKLGANSLYPIIFEQTVGRWKSGREQARMLRARQSTSSISVQRNYPSPL